MSPPEETFESLRPLLFSIAYRITGSVAESEDVVQDAWERYARVTDTIDSPRSFLSAVVTRLSIDVLRSARRRREEYVGQWFPEPLLSDPYEDPERTAELADSVSMATLLLLERLTPLERAVFVLREVFDFEFAEIAAAVGRSPQACRQLASRARQHVRAGRPRFVADRAEQAELAGRFFGALREGDVDTLRDLLVADVQLVGDDGGKAPHWGSGIVGADNVVRVLTTLLPAFAAVGGTVDQHELNGAPGAILRDGAGRVVNTWTLEIAEDRVQTIRTMINPDKLGHVGEVADAWAVVRQTLDRRREW